MKTYRCLNCREIFDEEELSTVTEDYGETHSACPYCGTNDMTAVKACPECGEYYEDGDLFGGRCPDCLRELIDYPVGLRYLLAKDYLRDFLGTLNEEAVGKADKANLIRIFINLEVDEKMTGKTSLLEPMRDYIMDDAVSACDFAVWLDGQEDLR